MKRNWPIIIIISILVILVLVAFFQLSADGEADFEEPILYPAEGLGGFCGSSTKGQCQTDSDCVLGGCSMQICQSANEEKIITNCEYKECYDKEVYAVNCECVNNQCLWQ